MDDSLGEAYATFGLSIETADCNWEETERVYQHALELNPNYPLAHEWYSSLLVGTGRFEEGLKEIRRAEELDPLSLREMTLTAWSYYQVRRFDEAKSKAQQMIELDRNYPQGPFQLGNILLETGETEKALAAIREAMRLMPGSALPMSLLCFALVADGKSDEAEAVRAELLKTASTGYVKEYFLAMAHLALGHHDEALTSLEIAVAERDPWLVWLGTEPKLDPLRKDPRFIKLFKDTNNPMAVGLAKLMKT